MTRKHVKRKVYPPRDPIALAIAGAAITADTELDKLRIMELQALEAFRTGAATKRDWDRMADVTNLCETLSRDGIGAEAMEAVERAEHALSQAHRRYIEHGRIAVSGPEMQALGDVYEYHHLQRTSVARSVYEQAITKTANRIMSAHPSLKVMLPVGVTT